ncbi:tyrosine-type recombinase/integrase, partial [Brucella intermedia]|uniref:tyrosine-type recombinase/integrase n=1 Tax=Brucella intermedia TaxID=94625 RepID=UPI00235F71C8
ASLHSYEKIAPSKSGIKHLAPPLPHCTAHGLRKTGATIAAENGATDDELMAILGWTNKRQTALYTRNASRKRLAGNAMHEHSYWIDEVPPPPLPDHQ